MKFKIGDHVFAIDDDLKGEIIGVSGSTCILLSEEGFEVNYEANELVKDTSKNERLDFSRNFNAFAGQNVKDRQKRIKQKIPTKKKKELPPLEVDLHIHKLVKNHKGLSNFDMLNIQLDTAKRQFDFAISKRISRVIFIHGVGTGVLKAELQYFFQKYDNIQLRDADYKKYGAGAMEIYITQKAM